MTNPTSKTPVLPFVRVLVWDAPLRVCHALMVACFTGTYLTTEQEEWRKVHATLGCTLGGLVVFRIIWGFVGTRYARFTNFLRAPGAIARQLRQLPHGWAERHTGHSPVGALFYVILLLSMLAVSASGWAASGTSAIDWLNELHEVAANVTLAFALLYGAGVALSSWRAGDNLLLSALHGTKLGSPDEAIQSARYGVALLLVAAVAAFWGYQWKSIAAGSFSAAQLTPAAEVGSGQHGSRS